MAKAVHCLDVIPGGGRSRRRPPSRPVPRPFEQHGERRGAPSCRHPRPCGTSARPRPRRGRCRCRPRISGPGGARCACCRSRPAGASAGTRRRRRESHANSRSEYRGIWKASLGGGLLTVLTAAVKMRIAEAQSRLGGRTAGLGTEQEGAVGIGQAEREGQRQLEGLHLHAEPALLDIVGLAAELDRQPEQAPLRLRRLAWPVWDRRGLLRGRDRDRLSPPGSRCGMRTISTPPSATNWRKVPMAVVSGRGSGAVACAAGAQNHATPRATAIFKVRSFPNPSPCPAYAQPMSACPSASALRIPSYGLPLDFEFAEGCERSGDPC